MSTKTCGLDDVFPPDDLGSGLCTPFVIYIPHIIAAFLLIRINSFEETYIPKVGIPKVGMAMLVYWMIWYCLVLGVLSVVWSSILYVMVWIYRALEAPGVRAPGPWKSNGALVKFCLRAQWTPQNWRIGNVFEWRDPSNFARGHWKF